MGVLNSKTCTLVVNKLKEEPKKVYTVTMNMKTLTHLTVGLSHNMVAKSPLNNGSNKTLTQARSFGMK